MRKIEVEPVIIEDFPQNEYISLIIVFLAKSEITITHKEQEAIKTYKSPETLLQAFRYLDTYPKVLENNFDALVSHQDPQNLALALCALAKAELLSPIKPYTKKIQIRLFDSETPHIFANSIFDFCHDKGYENLPLLLDKGRTGSLLGMTKFQLKLPNIITKMLVNYLSQRTQKDLLRLLSKIRDEGLKVVWEHIQALCEDRIIDEFSNLFNQNDQGKNFSLSIGEKVEAQVFRSTLNYFKNRNESPSKNPLKTPKAASPLIESVITDENYTSPFAKFPIELVRKIFDFLPIKEAARAGRTCKFFYKATHEDPIWKNLISRSAIEFNVSRNCSFIWKKNTSFIAASGKNIGQFTAANVENLKIFTCFNLPKTFARIIQIAVGRSLALTFPYDSHFIIYGVDEKGQPLLAAAGSKSHLLDNDKLPFGVCLVPLPDSLTCVTDIAIGDGCSAISAINKEGLPLLFTCGPTYNHLPKIGGGKVYPNMPSFLSEEIPEFFSTIFRLYITQNDDIDQYIVLHGEDYNGEPIFALISQRSRDQSYVLRPPSDWVDVRFDSTHTVLYGKDKDNQLFLASFNTPTEAITVSEEDSDSDLDSVKNRPFKIPEKYLDITDKNNEFSDKLFTCIKLPLSFTRIDEIIASNNTLNDGENLPYIVVRCSNNNGQTKHFALNLGKKPNIKNLDLPEDFAAVCQISNGIYHSIVSGIDAKGQALIACCGNNEKGQLGTGNQLNQDKFTVVPLPPGLRKIIRVSAGDNFTLVYGFNESGIPHLAATGDNTWSQCGYDSKQLKELDIFTFVPIYGSVWEELITDPAIIPLKTRPESLTETDDDSQEQQAFMKKN